ncbi:MAG: hypothetical protein ACRCVV_14730 [Shewanella sp.]|uniref:hypothetical protein n=1 Tax=Aeromonas popoffii TaxID=70856 RepID=UPI003F31B1DA
MYDIEFDVGNGSSVKINEDGWIWIKNPIGDEVLLPLAESKAIASMILSLIREHELKFKVAE